nr:hypothetical protein [Cohnella faecalis]
MNGIDLGELHAFPELPAKVDIGPDPYWLVKTNDGEYRLLSGICPMRGEKSASSTEAFYYVPCTSGRSTPHRATVRACQARDFCFGK